MPIRKAPQMFIALSSLLLLAGAVAAQPLTPPSPALQQFHAERDHCTYMLDNAPENADAAGAAFATSALAAATEIFEQRNRRPPRGVEELTSVYLELRQQCSQVLSSTPNPLAPTQTR